MKEIETIKEFGGYLNRYTHESSSCQCEMTFSVYLPPQSRNERVPALYWLSGLTCTDDNARTKQLAKPVGSRRRHRHSPHHEENKGKDDSQGTHQAKLLTNHGHNEVCVRLG